LVFCDGSDTQGEACLKVVRKVAPVYRGTFLFVSVSHQELHLYHTFGMKIGTPHPQIVILNITNDHEMTKYVLNYDSYALMNQKDEETVMATKNKDATSSHSLTEDTLHQFLNMYLSKELIPFYRSEENVPFSAEGSERGSEASAAVDASTDKDTDSSTSDGTEGSESESEEEQREMASSLLPLRVTSLTLAHRVVASTETVLLFITAPW
jgi:hypothetical protein